MVRIDLIADLMKLWHELIESDYLVGRLCYVDVSCVSW